MFYKSMEQFKEVENFDGKYQVSNYGRLKNRKGIVKQRVNNHGYPTVSLSFNGWSKTEQVHRIVAKTFLGEAQGRQVNHKNGIKTDNNLENLEWCTQTENMRHAQKMGLYPKRLGENNHCSKLKQTEVENIRELAAQGKRQADIAKQFNITQAMVSLIKNKHYWK